MNIPMIDECELEAYRSSTNRRAIPAYFLGRPTWVWQAAICRSKTRRPAAITE
jgi:hypothetical protein